MGRPRSLTEEVLGGAGGEGGEGRLQGLGVARSGQVQLQGKDHALVLAPASCLYVRTQVPCNLLHCLPFISVSLVCMHTLPLYDAAPIHQCGLPNLYHLYMQHCSWPRDLLALPVAFFPTRFRSRVLSSPSCYPITREPT